MSLRCKLIPLVLLAACGDAGTTSTDTSPDVTTTTSPDGATATDGTNTDGMITDETTTDATGATDGTAPSDVITPVPGQQQGTAAIGSPIVGAHVSGICADGSTPSGTTGSDGNFALDVEDDALPCAMTLTGGTAAGVTNSIGLHSLATAAGIVNITPLTDLILARAVQSVAGQALATWAAAPFDLEEVAEKIVAHSNVLRTVLVNAGYSIPASWSAGSSAPFTTPFAAAPATDAYDQLLEALADALADAGLSYADALSAYVASNAMPSAVVDPNNLPLTGDGAALGGADGATGTLNGTTYTYSAGLAWGYLPQYGVDTGSFSAYGVYGGGFDPLAGWRIGGFKAAVGTYNCKAFETDTTRIQLLAGGGVFYDTAPNGGACKIEVLSISPSAVTGRFSATFMSSVDGSIAGSVTDGYFYKHIYDGGGETLAEGEVGVSFDMDGQSWRYASANSLAFEGFAGLSSAPPDGPGFPIGIQIHSVPNAVGTYECDTDPDSYRQLNIWFTWDFRYYLAGVRQYTGNGPTGSRCKLVVTKVGGMANGKYFGTFEGTFEGTFVTEDLTALKVVTNGKFRFIGETWAPPEFLTPLVGSYAMKVTGSSFDGVHYDDDLAVTIAADGTITVGDEVFAAGQYSADSYLQSYNREPGILVTRAGSDGMSVRLGVPDSKHLQYVQLERNDGGYKYLYAGVRPIAAAMVDVLEDLIAGSPYTLRNISDVANGCPSDTVTVTGTADALSPYVKYNVPAGGQDGWGESSRLTTDAGDVVMVNYYTKVFFRPGGRLEVRQLGGSFQEYATWSEDPAAISAAGCP